MTLTGKAFKKLIMSSAQAAAPIEARCPHVDQCGGCAFQDRPYADQVAAKTAALREVWQDVELPAPLEVVPSPNPFEYRTRMDYVATKGRFGLRMGGRFNYIVELETCHLIPPAGFAAALRLWQQSQELGMPDYNIRSHEGFLRYIVVRRSPQNRYLLAAVTAQGDYDAHMDALATLALEQPGVIGFHWLLNDTLTDLSSGSPLRHWGASTLPMQVGPYTLHIGPNSFFQNNVHLLPGLLDAVYQAVTAPPAAPDQVVADLYSGVGAIALHLSRHVGRVVCVESQMESANLARYNVAHNNITNVSAQGIDVADFLRHQPPGAFHTVVADPPRTGLGAEVCRELWRLRPPRIVYVSCNPLTQAEDVARLRGAYRLTSLRGYDMFPHTPHIEAIAVLDAAS